MVENRPELGTLIRWTAERAVPFPLSKRLLLEMNARRCISQSLLHDRVFPMSQDQVVEQTGKLLSQMSGIVLEGNEVSIARRDTLTGEPYLVYLQRGLDSISFGEKDERGVFTQATVFNDGSTQLTLNFTAERFQRMRANPGIYRRAEFPRATLTIFKLLAPQFLELDSTTVTSAYR